MVFNPNKTHPIKEIYGLYVEDRTPKFKIYYKKSHVINAIKDKRLFHNVSFYEIPEHVKLYKIENGVWVEKEFKRIYYDRHETILGDNV